jgi:hypothetical protein
MANVIGLVDNEGFRSAPSPESSQPKTTQTALKLTQGTAGTETTATVVAGSRYRFTAYITGGFRFGLATVATDGNVQWVCPLYHSIEITIPQGYTTLHYTTDVNSALGFLVELIQ